MAKKGVDKSDCSCLKSKDKENKPTQVKMVSHSIVIEVIHITITETHKTQW